MLYGRGGFVTLDPAAGPRFSVYSINHDALKVRAHAVTPQDWPAFGAFVQTRVAQRVQAERLVLVGPAVNRFPTQTVPDDTIVIHGEEDDVVPLADVFAWARPQQLPIVVFPGSGHFFHGRLPQIARVVTRLWARPQADRR